MRCQLPHLLPAIFLVTACIGDGGRDDVEHDRSWGKADDTAVSGVLRITEVLAHPANRDAVFVELLDVGDDRVDLTDYTLSVGESRSELRAIDSHAHVIEPGQLAVVIDPDVARELDLAALGLPADSVVVTTEHDLGALLGESQQLIVRDDSDAATDKADATTSLQLVAVERTREGGFAPSAYGSSPGLRNAIRGDAIQLFFARPPEHTDDRIAPELAKVIDSATVSLDCAFFQVKNHDLIAAFVRAAQRGVRVRFVTDTTYFTHPDYIAGYQQLIAAGIPVIADQRSALMHSKFMVVDGRSVWTGSYNLVAHENRAFDHADNALYLRSKKLAELHTRQFEQMFAGRFGKAKAPSREHRAYVDGVAVDVYFAPTDSLKDRMLEAVSSARFSAHFATFSFYQRELLAAVVSVQQRGAEVRGMFDGTTTTQSNSAFVALAATGTDVRTADRAAPYLFFHNKYFVLDYGTAHATVATGSPNFSESAYKINDEALYLIRDRGIAAEYYEAYRYFYDAGVGPNKPTTAPPPVVISEVMHRESAAPGEAAFIELANIGTTAVDASTLHLAARGGVRVAVSGHSVLIEPGARFVIAARPELPLAVGTPLVLSTGANQIVSTCEASRFAGPGMSLAREDLGAPDRVSTWAAAVPSPGE